MKRRQTVLLLEAVMVWVVFGATSIVQGDIVFLDDFAEDSNTGRFVIEAEHYSSRSAVENAGWWEVDGSNHTFLEGPSEGQKTPTAERWEKKREIERVRKSSDSVNELAGSVKEDGTLITTEAVWRREPTIGLESRGNYMMALGSINGAIAPTDSSYADPFLDYRIAIETPGTYRLYARWAAWDINSDSLYAYIVKSDGTVLRGAGPDYFMYHQSRGGWYWDNRGIENTPYATLAGMPHHAVWTIKEPGVYIIRVAMREPRTALDTLVFQTSDLPSPGGSELAESQITDKPVENKAVLAVRAQLVAALEERRSALKTIDAALARETLLYEALEELLASGNYGDLGKWNITEAKQKVSQMIETEQQSREALAKGIEELEGALQALGWSPPPPPELVAYWKFDEYSGTTANDSASKNNGTIHGAEWTTGLFGSALSFDGKDDYVEVPDDSTLRFMQSSSFTISFWAMPVSQGHIVCKMRGARQRNVFGYQTAWSPKNSTFGFAVESSWKGAVSATTGLNSAPAGSWYHVAAVYADKDIKIYLNGELRENKTFDLSTSSTTPDKNLVIGARSYDSTITSFFGGKVDDVRIYDGALSDAEIWALCESGT